MIIYSSERKKKVKFEPIDPNLVKIYLCGPTVYDDAHLGHAKSAVSFDLLRRVLIELGYNVKFVKNYTDIDDKILKKMAECGKSLAQITTHYIKSYEDDMAQLNILEACVKPRATQCLDEIIRYIKELLDNKAAYFLQDGVYFDIQKDKDYLNLSGKTDTMEVKARVLSSQDKKDARDFVLWKFDENWYDSPFGKGRPGWHTECVAMIKKYLSSEGEFEIDIHAGGMDLLFPHHENEAAQCRCAHKKELAKYWMHNGFVQVNNVKMSKSLQNSFFVKDALALVPGEALRFYLLSSHYRSNFNYSLEDLSGAKKRLDKIYRLKMRVEDVKSGEMDESFTSEVMEFLSDDLNVSAALCVVDEMVGKSNDYLDKFPKDKAMKAKILANLEFVARVFGIMQNDCFEYFQFGVSSEQKVEILALLDERINAKKERNFARADEIRKILNDKNISIMDTPDGTRWEKI